ncbi:MAG: sodium:solute symporter family protein [Candidatus Omnitrophica bacterium]|nr:sodium:solute symporter family protein [Candidatus Omnitrophota bacterium]MCB9784125.1 sodium:solute symporter family protein [Candidatus Omnitrophota bacterium]
MNEPTEFLYGLTFADFVVLLVYLVGVTAIGVYTLIRVKDMEDYFMGGRRFGKVFMMFFAFGSGTSSEQAVSVVAKTWRVGLAGIWYQFLWLFSTPFYWILAPLFRRMRALTTADFFEKRFNSSVATLYCFVGIWMSITMIGATVYGSGKMVSGLTGNQLPYEYAVYAMTLMFLLYGVAGGLGAAVVTDFIQGVLTIAFSFMLLPFAISKAGGFAGLHANMPEPPIRENMFDMVASTELATKLGAEPITMFYIVMLSFNAMMSIVVQPHIMGVCAAGKTEMEGRVGFCFGNFIKRFCTIAWTFIGLACVVIYLTPERDQHYEEVARIVSTTPATVQAEASVLERFQADPENQHQLAHALDATRAMREGGANEESVYQEAYGAVDRDFADRVFGLAAHDILPGISPGLIGLLLAALLAAVMSTCDAQMMVASGLFTENIYRRFMIRNRTQKHYVQVGRLAGIVIVIASLMLNKYFKDAVHALEFFWKNAAVMGVAWWLGMFWRGYTSAGAWSSTVLGYVLIWMTEQSWFLGTFPGLAADPEAAALRISFPIQILIYLSIPAVVGIVVSLFTRRTDKQRLDEFYLCLRTPVRPGEKTIAPCTLPENPLPPETGKLINHPDIEIPRPSKVGMIGFAGAWCMVAFIIYFTKFLASYGAP